MSTKLQINPITDVKFGKYGRIIGNHDSAELVEKMQQTPLTGSVQFVASVDTLESLPLFKELSERVFGGLPIQLGYCNGDNHKLNAVEYHRTSEVLIPASDIIVILGSRQDIDTDKFTYDTSRMEAFKVPAGTIIELFATTLHFAPCSAPQSFRCAVVLPKGTGTPLVKEPGTRTGEDVLLAGTNVWIIAHPDSGMGGHIGLTGENLTV